ncbi:MAG: glycerol-3-phosphate 1-O-acyltransferase PlsY [Gammaproteobacteria bacterium]|nr:glycerol-3-phosphate 1-O-acyltransferase PlsY [Gammaproteobacteria bacterium]
MTNLLPFTSNGSTSITLLALELVAIFVSAYFCGSISAAIIVCRLMGLPDPRITGSNNPGATNVLRIGNKTAAIITLLGDALKGFLPVFIVAYGFDLDAKYVSAAALGAFLGHLYPVFFGFKGGKGVATAFGIAYGLNLWLGLAASGTWLLMAVSFRYSSLAALTTFFFLPIYCYLFLGSTLMVASMSLISLLLFYRHRSNIRNLLNGQESRIGQKK